jgi:hypothetical protein
MVNKQKGEKQTELDKIYADAKAKVTRETESAIAGARQGMVLRAFQAVLGAV